MHNNIMVAGLRDHPPILATRRYAQPAYDMWIAIERLQQGESLNKQDVKTIATMQVNVQFLQQLQLEWSKFVTVVKKIVDLDKESYHKLFDILKQYQNDLNEICAEMIAKNANPLALVVAAQQYLDPYYQAPKFINICHHNQYNHLPPDFSLLLPKTASRDMDMQKNLVAKYFKKIYKPTNNNLRTSSNTRNKTIDTSPRHFAKECRKPKREKDYTYHKEKMLLCKQAEKGVPLQAEQADWLEDTDEEVNEQELEAH
ncbi:hypothetical protein Tco_0765272 [Tanacetum coccineum]